MRHGHPSALRLAAEFAGLYLLAPVAVAVAVPDDLLVPALFGLAAVGAALLHATPGFAWRELARGWRGIGWGGLAAFAAATGAVGLAVVATLRPDALLEPGRSRPLLLLAIWILYPPLSALPQEIVFRPLFFRRYAPILPAGPRTAIALNACVFSLAHLPYGSWVTAALTFAGGLVFAHAYRVRRSFPEAVALHAAAGCVLFAMGLGEWFHAGGMRWPS